jgi:hypothetical protein
MTSAVITVALTLTVALAGVGAADFSWQEPQATVLPSGNLEWAPRPFGFEKGASVRYIDFEAGDDAKDGLTKETAWKHHPWDPNAIAAAKACAGIQTYVFKCGVIYRCAGPMKAAESGKPGDPIRLTSDPAWGTGDAMILGSTQIKGGWKKADANEAPGMPEPDKIWYIDLGKDYDPDGNAFGKKYSAKFSAMWQMAGDKVERLNIARQPNYDLSDPNNPVKNWFVWTKFQPATQGEKKSITSGTFTAPELKGLGDKDLLNGAVIWTETSWLMSPHHKVSPKNYNPEAGTVDFADSGGADYSHTTDGGAKVHFMIENVAKFLDAPGEYFFDVSGPKAGRLFLRPPADADPNTVAYEVAQTRFPVWVADQHDIVLSGLTFRFNDPDDGTYGYYPYQVGASPCVRIVGNCANVTVKNCKFQFVAGAVAAFPRPGEREPEDGDIAKEVGAFANDVMDNIVISDNDLLHVEKACAIIVAGNSGKQPTTLYGRLLHAEVLRNRIVDAGFRADSGPTTSIPAISVNECETCEIAGNIVDTSYGNGIFTHGGKRSGDRNVVALTRMLVHDNQLDNTMLGCNDYGGLEHFQGGPIYLYNNVTRNCVGNKFLGGELGYSLYLDGGFKCYSFNNIIAGRVDPAQPNYYNNCGYFMVFGFMDQCFNNTICHFQFALDGSSGNRSNVLGNLMLDCNKSFIRQNRAGDVSMMGGGDTGQMGVLGIPTMAYASNVFYGTPKGTGDRNKKDAFGEIGGVDVGGKAPTYSGNTLDELSQSLASMQCRLSGVGTMAPEMPIADPAKKDYRLTANSTANGHGVKYFVPWALARTVGEWNFYKSASSPQTVLGEGFYMTDEYVERGMYYQVPRNDLNVSQCAATDYVAGALEDWIEGALAFDGKRIASISQADLTKSIRYIARRGGAQETLDGLKRETVDMGTNNFLIEAVFRTDAGNTGGVLASKMGESGYELGIGPAGEARLTVQWAFPQGRLIAEVASQARVNDGNWHHVIAEVDRVAGKATIYVDGKASGEGRLAAKDMTGKMAGIPKDLSLANAADFVVGKGLAGAVDFLRVCRSTLAESKTSIGELYAWEFDGPAQRDFLGQKPAGKRDAGAIGMAK